MEEHGFKAHYKDDASLQAGNLQEAMWREQWRETVEQFTTHMQTIAQHINDNHDVEGVCKRIQSQVLSRGPPGNKMMPKMKY